MTKASTPKSGRRSMSVLWIVPLLVASGFVVIHFGTNAFPSSPPLRDRPIAALLENAVLHLRFGDCQPAQRVNIIVKCQGHRHARRRDGGTQRLDGDQLSWKH